MESKKIKRTGIVWFLIGALCLAGAVGWVFRNENEQQSAGEASDVVMETIQRVRVESAPVEKTKTKAGKTLSFAYFEEELTYPDYVLNPDMPMPIVEIDGHEYVSTIRFPSLDMELPVMAEWSYKKLGVSPCRYTGSVYKDDLIVCAHNYNTHFGGIKTLLPGDLVVVADMDGNEFTFQVTEQEILQPYMLPELLEGEWDLTLFTCTVGGGARVVVRCERIDL